VSETLLTTLYLTMYVYLLLWLQSETESWRCHNSQSHETDSGPGRTDCKSTGLMQTSELFRALFTSTETGW